MRRLAGFTLGGALLGPLLVFDLVGAFASCLPRGLSFAFAFARAIGRGVAPPFTVPALLRAGGLVGAVCREVSCLAAVVASPGLGTLALALGLSLAFAFSFALVDGIHLVFEPVLVPIVPLLVRPVSSTVVAGFGRLVQHANVHGGHPWICGGTLQVYVAVHIL